MNIDQAARTPIEHEAANPDWRFSERAERHDTSAAIHFRQFCILPGARILLFDGRPVPLGSRAFDLLLVLVQARGTVVTKEVIARQVWPSTIVEESNLRFQMSCLRKALGVDRDLIKTVPGRGYLLAADVDEQSLQVPQSSGARAATDFDLAARPPYSDLLAARRSEAARPTLVLSEEDEPMRERVQALLRLAGLQVQLFGSVGAFLSDTRAAA